MRIPEAILRMATEFILVGLGENREGARIASSALVGADMRGVSTHGVNLLRLIAKRKDAGMLALPTRVATLRDEGATAALDGGNGLGQIAAAAAFELCAEKASRFGVGMVTLRNTNNVGALGILTSGMAARERVIAILTTNGNPSVAPFGAAKPFFGTNPLSIAVPSAGGGSFVLDMSSSVVARGKIRLAALSGQAIPEGWALDADGDPTTDPKRALDGSLLPLGGPKGSGLAFMIDVLSGILPGASYGRALKSFHELEGATGVGACCIAVDVGRFMDADVFGALVAAYAADIKALKRGAGFDEILLPGELELQREAECRRLGVEVPEAVVEALDGILSRMGGEISLVASVVGKDSNE